MSGVIPAREREREGERERDGEKKTWSIEIQDRRTALCSRSTAAPPNPRCRSRTSGYPVNLVSGSKSDIYRDADNTRPTNYVCR